MEIKVNKIDDLNNNQKVFLAHKIFDYWLMGNIKNKDDVFLPTHVNIYNAVSILKVLKTCSKIENDEYVDEILKHFESLNFFEKLDFMIYLFDEVNEIDIIPNYITNSLNFKDLSNEILKYKLKS